MEDAAIGETTPESDLRLSTGGSGWVPTEHETEALDNAESRYGKKPEACSSILIFSKNPELCWTRISLEQEDVQKNAEGETEVRLDINKLAPLLECVFIKFQNKILRPQQNQDQNNIPKLIEQILVNNSEEFYTTGFTRGEHGIPTAISIWSGDKELQTIPLKSKHFRIHANSQEVQTFLGIKKFAPVLARIFDQQQKDDDLLAHESEEHTAQLILPDKIKEGLNANNNKYYELGNRYSISKKQKDIKATSSLLARHPKKILTGTILTTAVVCTAAGYYLGNKH